MKYLILLLFCFSCKQSPDYQKMVDKTTNFLRFNERVTRIYILKQEHNQQLKNGKYHQFLTENELLNRKETFCDLIVKNDKKRGTTNVIMSFCSGNNYTYYFSGTDNLDSMDVIQTKREPNRLDSLCNERLIKNHPELFNKTRKGIVSPPQINNGK